MALATAFLILLVAAPVAVYGASYTVGDTNGWTSSGEDYTAWTSGKTFTVGDTLVFNYDSSHKVDVVNQAAYSSCSSSNPIESHDSSPTTITLSQAGTHYYICPTAGHCSNGQKLLVTVVAAGTPTTSPASPPPPTTTTPANNGSPPPPPPPPNGAESSLNMNLVGVPLVLATLIAVMG